MRASEGGAQDDFGDHKAAIRACEAEPIRTPGRLQGHGGLMVIGPQGLISAFSDNLADMLGLAQVEFGDPYASLLPPQLHSAVAEALTAWPSAQTPKPLIDEAMLGPLGRRFEVLAHRQSTNLIIELLPRSEALKRSAEVQEPAQDASDNVYRRALSALEAVHALTGYDRIMMYRFHPNWSGEVIAELRAPDMTPYLGLRYPASDIPSQARALYLENPLRLIPNVNAPTRALLSRETIDLSLASLRAVSPYHLEYLRNMGVVATLTLSVIVEGQLWGMVACHHRAARMIGSAAQQQALEAVKTFERSLLDADRRRAKTEAVLSERALEDWRVRLQGADPIAEILAGVDSLLKSIDADGVALVMEDQCFALGATPAPPWLAVMAGRLGSSPSFEPVVTDQLNALADAPPQSCLAGAMMMSLSAKTPCALFVFRRAQVHDVHWGGDPSRPFEISPKDGAPSPRRSFALWRQTVIDKSIPWSSLQRAIFTACARALSSQLVAPQAINSVKARMEALAQDFLHSASAQHWLVDALPSSSSILLWIEDERSARLLLANRHFTELMGLDLRDIVGKSPDYLFGRTQLDASVLNSAVGDEIEMDLWSPARGLRHILARREMVVQHIGAGGTTLSIHGLLLHDATDASRTQEALRSAVRQAESADQARGALMRNMSHELRTPLNAILGYSDTMVHELCGPLGQDAYREAAGEIAASARHLLQLINDTLDMARLEEGKLSLSERVFDLRSSIHQCLGMMQVIAEKRDVTLNVDSAKAQQMIRADEIAVKQILINLLNNALKFSHKGGSVTVTVRENSVGACEIAVRDTGVGIAEHNLDKLFRPFSQIQHESGPGQGGNGLGLSIVKALVELHSGGIAVSSRIGFGSTFTVTLPAWRVEASR